MAELVNDNGQPPSPVTNLVDSNEGIVTNEMENGTSDEEKIKVVRFQPSTQRYTKEALLELQNLSSSKVRPKFLDNFPGLDLELDGNTRKGSRPVASGKPTKRVRFDLPPLQNQPSEYGDAKIEKKPQNAKDRLKKDQDNIVLSPKRRSFNSGCFVSMNGASGPKRSNSPLNTSGKQYVKRKSNREPRPVGSGRLMSRDSWDSGYHQQENGIANSFNYGKGDFRESSSHNSMESRRKDFVFDRGENNRYRNYDRFKGSGNFDRRRNESYRTQEEPESITDGLTSQHDTIELCGFEVPPTDKTNKKKTKSAARAKKNSIDSTSTESTAAIRGTNECNINKTKKEKEEDKNKKSTVEKQNNDLENQAKKDSESITDPQNNYMVNQSQNPIGYYGGPSNSYRNQQPNMQVPNDVVMNLMDSEAHQIQKQHENMVAKAMATQQQQHHQSKQQMYKLPVELQNMVNYYTPTKDILQSREVQEMLMGIKRGEVMLYHLVEQWKNTNPNQSRYRETLIYLMKLIQHSSNARKMVIQQDLAYQQQAALYQIQKLKKQLLDQTHNKRMDNVHNSSYRGEGPIDLGSSHSQSQPRIGLTPTSVLRKMTSTSEPLVDKHHIPDERVATQQALQHQINTLQQQIQQHQLMQHQAQNQHQTNNMNGRSRNYSSGDKSCMNRVQSLFSNQVARWFSPELLAQASAGRLPNMPAIAKNVNMLSVEDIEKFQIGGRS